MMLSTSSLPFTPLTPNEESPWTPVAPRGAGGKSTTAAASSPIEQLRDVPLGAPTSSSIATHRSSMQHQQQQPSYPGSAGAEEFGLHDALTGHDIYAVQQQQPMLHRRAAATAASSQQSAKAADSATAARVVHRLPVDPSPSISHSLSLLLRSRRIQLTLLSLLLFCTILLSVPWNYIKYHNSLPSYPSESTEVYCSSAPYTSESVASLLPSFQPSCIACPPHSTCRAGKRRCKEGYFAVSQKECVVEKEETKAGWMMKEKLISELELHAGRRVCGDTITPGASSPDLTHDELLSYIRPFHLTPPEQHQFDQTYTYANQWLMQDAVYEQVWNEKTKENGNGNPNVRVVVINHDSRQPVRMRAVYPRKAFGCKMNEMLQLNWIGIILDGISFTAAICFILFLRYMYRYYIISSALSRTIITRLRNEHYSDSDTPANGDDGVIYANISWRELKEDYLEKAMTGGKRHGQTASFSQLESLLSTFIWTRVQSLLYANKYIESSVFMFRLGEEKSWKWIGPSEDEEEVKGKKKTSKSKSNSNENDDGTEMKTMKRRDYTMNEGKHRMKGGSSDLHAHDL